jgi:hypothetical protein
MHYFDRQITSHFQEMMLINVVRKTRDFSSTFPIGPYSAQNCRDMESAHSPVPATDTRINLPVFSSEF